MPMQLPTTAAYVYADPLSRHVLRQDHPMRPVRLRYTFELLQVLGAFDGAQSQLVPPRIATEAELLAFHTPDYVAAVRSLSGGLSMPSPGRYGFGHTGDNPIYPGMYEAALLSTGASLAGAELLVTGKAAVAFSPAGGLHHAMPSNASGFCIFNDPVVAIYALLARGMKVAYVDIDAHHGDGVQCAFYDTDAVLTVSLHESGRYLFPGTGFVEEMGSGKGVGYSVNVPLAPYTGDDVYLWAFEEVVPPVLGAFKPDILVTQLGIDTYYNDPITHLALTSRGYSRAVELLAQQARTLNIPWLALGGGGYNLSAVARCWALAYGIMSGRQWPESVPQETPVEVVTALGKTTLRDKDAPALPAQVQEATRRFAEETIKEVKARVFPFHGLRA
ncbi:MAG: acetoin utilization protein AcuC [Chloroflexi bacterium]|nr:acetoin utilization protein AcuC [Chloroflexota bacterium]